MSEQSIRSDAPRHRERNLFPKAGAWAMFGLRLLFLVPFLGLIAAVVFSFVPVNPNLKSLARAELLMQLLYALVAFIVLVLFFTLVWPTLSQLMGQTTALLDALDTVTGLDPDMLASFGDLGIDPSLLEGLDGEALQNLSDLLKTFGG